MDLRGRRRATRSLGQEKTPAACNDWGSDLACQTAGMGSVDSRFNNWILRALYRACKRGPPACRSSGALMSAPLVSVAHDERSGADNESTRFCRQEALRRTWSLGTNGDLDPRPPRVHDLGDVGLSPGPPKGGPFSDCLQLGGAQVGLESVQRVLQKNLSSRNTVTLSRGPGDATVCIGAF